MAADPIFAAYRATAPLLDLRAYVRCAEQLGRVYHLPAETLQIFGEMLILHDRGAVAPPHRRDVWTLIDRFKASIPRWWAAEPRLRRRSTALTVSQLQALRSAAMSAVPVPAPQEQPPMKTKKATKKATRAKTKTAKNGRAAVDWVAAGKKAAATRKRNLAAAAARLTIVRKPRGRFVISVPTKTKAAKPSVPAVEAPASVNSAS